MIRKRRDQKEIPTPKTEAGKTKLTIKYLCLEKHIVSLVNRRPLSYPYLNKCENAHKVQTAQKCDPKT